MLPSRGLLLRPGHALRPPVARGGAGPRLTTALGGGEGVGRQAGRARAFGSRSATTAASSSSLLLAGRGRRTVVGGVEGRSPAGSVAAFSLFPWRSSNKTTPSPAPDAAAADVASASTSASASASASSPSTAPSSSPSSASSSANDALLSSAADPADPAAAVADLLDGGALLDLPEQIGYLRALGLDFGWGPSSICQAFLEHVHIDTGLPWWASIVVAATLFRAAIFFPSLAASEQSAKMQQLRRDPEFAEALAEMQKAAMQRGQGGGSSQNRVLELRMKTRRMQQQAGISTWKMFIPMINIPFAYGMFRLLRSMAALPVPGWEQAGLFWFTDFSVPDPYFALPIASAGLMFLIFRNNIKYMAPQQAQIMKMIQIVITPISILVTAKMSAGVTFLFFVTSCLQLLQTWLWHQPWLRQWKGLPPMHTLLGGGAGGAAAGSGPNAAPPVFRLDPNSSWQAPRTISTTARTVTAAPGQPAAPPSTVEVVKQGWDKMMGNAKDKQGASLDKASLQKAFDYERRRAAEDDEALFQRREAERQYRAMKKTLAQAEASAAATAAANQKTQTTTSKKKAAVKKNRR